jgi:hypothetical protein
MSGGNHHAVKVLTTPDGETVEVDEALASVVQEIWRAEIITVSCCQDAGDAGSEPSELPPHLAEHYRHSTGYAYIDFLDDEEAAAFLSVVANQGPRGPRDAFYTRMVHWAAAGAWRKKTHFWDAGMDDAGRKAEFYPSFVQISFPVSDIREITRRLRRHNRLTRAA